MAVQARYGPLGFDASAYLQGLQSSPGYIVQAGRPSILLSELIKGVAQRGKLLR
ncbi:MAG: hypothetical protein HOL98_08640 [Gammaproteobacteria bacterium]|nr:hypothetical protein [Gammaproteobacteria bacterium]MBT5203507.1 hypothetical protein [Gammaproteobacteria bacterium]MBT5600973.1 hypothetical protein [Gammaproteobacteria bacterium]MBT6245294.1 hypothetical protein [Gammaproteobacteria bacterium]